MMPLAKRAFILLGGLAGALGVGLAARAAHGAPDLETPAQFLLFHAAAFLALSAPGANRLRSFGGLGLAIGLVLFCGDLIMRHATGDRLFPYAAPIGGSLLILAWLVIAASALVRPAQ